MPYPQRTILLSASNTEILRNSAQRMAVAEMEVLKDRAKRYRFGLTQPLECPGNTADDGLCLPFDFLGSARLPLTSTNGHFRDFMNQTLVAQPFQSLLHNV